MLCICNLIASVLIPIFGAEIHKNRLISGAEYWKYSFVFGADVYSTHLIFGVE